MHRAEIDDEVFAYLQQQARPLVDDVNSVLRRLLLDDAAPKSNPTGRRPGHLLKLVEAGVVAPGDRLTHTRKRSGQTYHATVSEDGWTELPDGQPFIGPSPALKKCVGTEISGNANWTHDRSGRTLRELLDSLQHGGTSS